MRITFSNLGTIEQTALDLKPLTVIIGPNNASKTYVAYSIYGLWNAIRRILTNFPTPRWKPELTSNGTVVRVPVSSFRKEVDRGLRQSEAEFLKEIDEFFQDSSRMIFAETTVRVRLDAAEITNALELEIARRENECSSDGVMLSFCVRKGSLPPHLHLFSMLRRIMRSLFAKPFLLPAERTALVTTYKALTYQRFQSQRDAGRSLLVQQQVEGLDLHEFLNDSSPVRFPQPIEDFLDFLNVLGLREDQRGLVEKAAGSEEELAATKDFHALADDIEAKLQSKNKVHLRATRFGGNEIRVDVKKGLSIDLYNASSSIKQLTPLVLYLRYRARRGDLLVIDEPEMNLHPEGQAKLLEVLGILVNLGVRVLLTTHSPYLMAHLNNIVAGAAGRPRILKKQAEALYLGDARAFLPMDRVGAYEMRDNKLCSLKDEDYGIRWDTLSDVSVDLQQRFFSIKELDRRPPHGKGK